MAKFRVLQGLHIEGKNADGSQRVYRKGEIVDSATDLNKLNYPGSIKFEQVSNDAPAEASTLEPNLDERLLGMTIAQLRTFAADNSIEIDEVYSLKKDIIDCILVGMEEK